MVSLIVSGILDISLSVLLDTYRLRYQKVIALSAPHYRVVFCSAVLSRRIGARHAVFILSGGCNRVQNWLCVDGYPPQCHAWYAN